MPARHRRELEQGAAAALLRVAEVAGPLVPRHFQQPLLDAVVEPGAAEDELLQPVDERLALDERDVLPVAHQVATEPRASLDDSPVDGKRGDDDRSGVHERSVVAGYPFSVAEANYTSGDDYVVEFLGYRFGFNADDFEERITAAAVRLGLIGSNDLDDDETADLVELAADGRIAEARSQLGRDLVRHWERVGLLEGESLVYWLRKLVFRGAWLDHRVKEGLLEVTWDEESGDFGYAEPRGGRALLELAPVPSWHALQFRR